tara:strand:+ start:2544 stop:5009 length:2466 start_codon:yes stop_codon:yes gene_type:complete
MANSTIGALNVKITADATSVKAGLRQTNKALTTTTKKAKTANKAFSDFSGALGLNTLALSAAFGVAATKAVKYADAFTSINNKLKLATADSEQLAIVTDKLFESSNNTGSSIEASVELYAKLERSTKTLGISQDRLLNITDSINKSFIISGASTAEASGAIRQLGQALSSGVLRGEEFNSISEGAPIIMEAITKATGKTQGQLRKLAAEGKITSEVLIESLERYKKKIDGDYATAQKTFAQKLEASTNEVIRFVGESDNLNKGVDAVGDTLLSLASNLDAIGNILNTVIIVAIGKYSGALLTAAASSVSLSLAQATTAKATMRVGASTTITTAAMGKAIITTKALAGATVGLRGAMAFLGGPAGVLITVGLALLAYSDDSITAEEQTRLNKEEVDKLKKSYKELSLELQKIELKKIADAMKVNRLESTALINTIQRLKNDMALPANSRAIGSLMFQSADAKKKLDELNSSHDLLLSKQSALTTPPSKDGGGNDDSGDGKTKPLVDIDSGSGPTQSEKDKAKRDQEAAAQYIQTLQNQFLTAGQLETNRYKVETQKLAEAFALKTAITQEEQQKQNILKEDLESQHLAKMSEIKAAAIPPDNSIGMLEALGLQYETEEMMLSESLIRKQKLIDAAKATGKITEEEHALQSLDITAKGEEAKRKITLQNVQQGFQILAAGSKKAQKLMKAAAIVNAIIAGKEAAVSAWKAGMATGGPYAPLVAASYTAASIARTASMISSIKGGGSASSGGGGGGSVSTPSGSGGSQTSSQQQQSQPAPAQISRTIDINLPSTGLLSIDQVRELMGQINEQVGDGVQLNTGNI